MFRCLVTHCSMALYTSTDFCSSQLMAREQVHRKLQIIFIISGKLNGILVHLTCSCAQVKKQCNGRYASPLFKLS